MGGMTRGQFMAALGMGLVGSMVPGTSEGQQAGMTPGMIQGRNDSKPIQRIFVAPDEPTFAGVPIDGSYVPSREPTDEEQAIYAFNNSRFLDSFEYGENSQGRRMHNAVFSSSFGNTDVGRLMRKIDPMFPERFSLNEDPLYFLITSFTNPNKSHGTLNLVTPSNNPNDSTFASLYATNSPEDAGDLYMFFRSCYCEGLITNTGGMAAVGGIAEIIKNDQGLAEVSRILHPHVIGTDIRAITESRPVRYNLDVRTVPEASPR